MWSSSTASTTWPRAVLDSISRMRAARSTSTVASCSESSSCRAYWRPMTTKRTAPSRTRIAPKVARYQAVRPRRRRASGCRAIARSVAKAVAGAPQRMDQLRLEGIVDLAAQPPNEHLEHVRERIVIVVPHVRGDRRAVDHLAAMEDEELEQRELFRRQLHRLPAALHAARREIHLQILDRHDARHQRRPPPRECADARDQLAKGEWLRHVVVRADLEPHHAIVDRVPRREHENGRLNPARPQVAAKLEPRAARKHHVEHDDVEAAALRLSASRRHC